MNDSNVELASFIVSNTSVREMELHWSKSVAEMTDRHIVFQQNVPGSSEALLQQSI